MYFAGKHPLPDSRDEQHEGAAGIPRVDRTHAQWSRSGTPFGNLWSRNPSQQRTCIHSGAAGGHEREAVHCGSLLSGERFDLEAVVLRRESVGRVEAEKSSQGVS